MMRYFWIIFSFLLLMASCGDGVEHHLEGKWQLRTVEENGVVHPVDTVWYNFQTSLFSYQVFDASANKHVQNYGYKTLEDDSRLELELVNYGRLTAQQFVERYTDWNSKKEFFHIQEISRKKLVLSRDGKTYVFRKY